MYEIMKSAGEDTMIALKITNVKQFMGKLLGSEDFDSFLMEEASISTYNTFRIDGRQNRDFYSSEEWEDKELRPYDFTPWKTIRPICFDLIKGTRTPSSFQFVLHLIPEYTASILKKGDTSVTPMQCGIRPSGSFWRKGRSLLKNNKIYQKYTDPSNLIA